MFNIYFAGSRQDSDEYFLKKKVHRLYSYANDKKNIEAFIQAEERGPLLVDSGAFSVAHSNIKIDIDQYIDYINNHPTIENFIELDVIPYPVLNQETAKYTAEKSWENYLYMIERVDDWEKILPVFHFGEDLKYLERILAFEYKGKKVPFMCIGGRHGVSTNKQEKYFNTIYRKVHNSPNPDIKIHVLGMTVFSTLEKFPFYSADSTTYLQNAIYGKVFLSGTAINISKGNKKQDNFEYYPEHAKAAVIKEIEDKGYTLEQLQDDYMSRLRFNIDFVLEFSHGYEYSGYDCFKKSRGLF